MADDQIIPIYGTNTAFESHLLTLTKLTILTNKQLNRLNVETKQVTTPMDVAYRLRIFPNPSIVRKNDTIELMDSLIFLRKESPEESLIDTNNLMIWEFDGIQQINYPYVDLDTVKHAPKSTPYKENCMYNGFLLTKNGKNYTLTGNKCSNRELNMIIFLNHGGRFWTIEPINNDKVYEPNGDKDNNMATKMIYVMYALDKNQYYHSNKPSTRKLIKILKPKRSQSQNMETFIDETPNEPIDYNAYLQYLTKKYALAPSSLRILSANIPHLMDNIKNLSGKIYDPSSNMTSDERHLFHMSFDSLHEDLAKFPIKVKEIMPMEIKNISNDFPKCGVNVARNNRMINIPKRLRSRSRISAKTLAKRLLETPIIETAVLVDEFLVKSLSLKLGLNQSFTRMEIRAKLVKFILAIYQGVNYLYQDPSLGKPIRIQVTHLFLFMKNPEGIPTSMKDAEVLLETGNIYFVKSRIQHSNVNWDTLSWITGQNLYSIRMDGSIDYSTQGLSYFGKTICHPLLSASIVEMKWGFASIPFIAHEIGHNLNFDHDQDRHCGRGYIMSAYVENAVKQWSSCTKKDWMTFFKDAEFDCLFNQNRLTSIKHKFESLSLPGQRIKLDKQCEKSYANQSVWDDTQPLEAICRALRCKNGSVLQFPALEGTPCGENKICRFHRCVRAINITKKDIDIQTNDINGKSQSNKISPEPYETFVHDFADLIKTIKILINPKEKDETDEGPITRFVLRQSDKTSWKTTGFCEVNQFSEGIRAIRIVERGIRRYKRIYIACPTSKRTKQQNLRQRLRMNAKSYAQTMCKWLRNRQSLYQLTGRAVSIQPNDIKANPRIRTCNIYCELKRGRSSQRSISLKYMSLPDGTPCPSLNQKQPYYCFEGRCTKMQMVQEKQLGKYLEMASKQDITLIKLN